MDDGPPSAEASAENTVGEGQCNKIIERAMERNMYVKFMVDKMAEAGCKIDRTFFKAERCDKEVGGGFVPGLGVIVCHNKLSSKQEVENAMVHELVHAYDQCRAADLDWTNIRHHACSEVRAAALSGDCDWLMEFYRGNYRLRGGHQVCAKRRAALSVAMNDSLSGRGPRARDDAARQAVEDVFEECYADTAPFERMP